jgi:hypothetical protein
MALAKGVALSIPIMLSSNVFLNALVYFASDIAYSRKRLMKPTPEACTKKLFTAVIYGFP